MIRLKKMMALAIAVVMVICTMNFTVFAEPGDLSVNGDLEVQGLGEDDIVQYYQLLRWNTNPADDPDDPGDPDHGWVWGNGVTVTGGKVGTYDVTDIIGTADGQNRITAEIAGALAAAASTPMTPAGLNDGGTWTVSGVPAGLYMVIITSKTPGTMYNPIFVAANFYGNDEPMDSANSWIVDSAATYSDHAMAKKSVIPVEKTASGTDDDDPDTVDVGDVIDFTVTTTIPKFASNYTHPVFQIDDTLDGLELTGAPVVEADGAAEPLEEGEDKDYELLSGGAEGNASYSIKFTEKYLKTVNVAGQGITVTYSAKVTSSAVYNVNSNKNTVDIKFSTYPTDTTGHGLLRDETNHFTFSIDADFAGDSEFEESASEVVKIGVDKEGNPVMSEQSYEISGTTHHALAGAEFGLYTDEECNTLYTNDIIYPNGCKVTSDSTGRLTIRGLDAGNYWLKEIKAPAGFLRIPEAIPVTITATIIPETYTFEEDGVEVTVVTNKLTEYTVEIGNYSTTYNVETSKSTIEHVERNEAKSSDTELKDTKGVELPATGGMGTTIFYVIGAVLVLGAGILLVTRRRMDTI